jgi:hypothetical protein
MKHKLKTALILASVVGLASSLSATQIRIQSPEASAPYVGLDAAGVSLTTYPAGSWRFAAGTFSGDFSPDNSNWADWEANWSTFNSTTWTVSPVFAAGRFNAQWAVTAELEAAWAGETGYIWGYNSQAFDAASQWLLITNPVWEFPPYDPLSTTATGDNVWNTALPGNVFITGTNLENAGFQMQAIPEPSTYALIFGLGILGFLGFRRFRK